MRCFCIALGVALAAVSGCSLAPPQLSQDQASELLSKLATGRAEQDLCSTEGRLALRGAVRSYARAMAERGLSWPPLPEGDAPLDASRRDVGVLIAYAGGWLETSDFSEPAGSRLSQIQPLRWSELRDVRAAIPHACSQAAEWHAAATIYAYERLRLEKGRHTSPEWRSRQHAIVDRAADRMERAREALATGG